MFGSLSGSTVFPPTQVPHTQACAGQSLTTKSRFCTAKLHAKQYKTGPC